VDRHTEARRPSFTNMLSEIDSAAPTETPCAHSIPCVSSSIHPLSNYSSSSSFPGGTQYSPAPLFHHQAAADFRNPTREQRDRKSRPIFLRYKSILPTSFTYIVLSSQRLLTLATCCGFRYVRVEASESRSVKATLCRLHQRPYPARKTRRPCRRAPLRKPT
jgi:hypothetical protein